MSVQVSKYFDTIIFLLVSIFWKSSVFLVLNTNFLGKIYLGTNFFPCMHTNVKYTLVFSLFDNIFWKLSSKLIENV